MTGNDTNLLGTVHGGVIMKLVDDAAGAVAGRHSGGPAVTASMDEMVFLEPVRVGDLVHVKAQVNWTGRSSMEVGVRVLAERWNESTPAHAGRQRVSGLRGGRRGRQAASRTAGDPGDRAGQAALPGGADPPHAPAGPPPGDQGAAREARGRGHGGLRSERLTARTPPASPSAASATGAERPGRAVTGRPPGHPSPRRTPLVRVLRPHRRHPCSPSPPSPSASAPAPSPPAARSPAARPPATSPSGPSVGRTSRRCAAPPRRRRCPAARGRVEAGGAQRVVDLPAEPVRARAVVDLHPDLPRRHIDRRRLRLLPGRLAARAACPRAASGRASSTSPRPTSPWSRCP